MHDRHDQNVVLLNCIENTIRKLTCHTPPNIFINRSIAGWGFSDPIDCLLDRVYERLSNLNSLLCEY